MNGFETTSAMKAREVELQKAIFLPDEIQVGDFLGRGRRSFAYKGKYENKDVVIKIYRKEFIEKYQQKCQVDIAEFEYERNTKLYCIDEIRPYISRPYRVFTWNCGYTHSFIQEYVEGITLKQLIAESGFLPTEVLDAGYKIVKIAESNGVHDIDISQGNIMVTHRKGVWMPKLYDFNLLPQHISPPNLFIALGIRLGLRRKSWRDYRSLKSWESAGIQQQSSSMHRKSE